MWRWKFITRTIFIMNCMHDRTHCAQRTFVCLQTKYWFNLLLGTVSVIIGFVTQTCFPASVISCFTERMDTSSESHSCFQRSETHMKAQFKAENVLWCSPAHVNKARPAQQVFVTLTNGAGPKNSTSLLKRLMTKPSSSEQTPQKHGVVALCSSASETLMAPGLKDHHLPTMSSP